MIDPIQVLYTYAQENMVCALLSQEHEYASVRQSVEKQEETLRALVGEAHKDQLEALLDEQNLLAFFQGRALFRAGFQIAMELTLPKFVK